MALVLTLLAVSFLVAITVQLATSVNWQMQGAGNLRDSVQLDAINRSGLSLVRAALLADLKENQFDSIHDSWGKLTGEDAPTLFGAGALKINITDLSGLLQVNALVPDEKNQTEFQKKQTLQINLWKRFLTSGKFAVADDAEADKIIDALIDWIDENDTERDNGAENGYYLSRSPSYPARNGPVTYLTELLLIRDMTKELFYGNDQDQKLALADYLTVAGRDGKINVNSAPAEILMALDPAGNMTEQAAKDLVEFAREEDNMAALASPQWVTSQSGINLSTEGLAVVKSSCFKVSVTARLVSLTRSGTGILQRNDKGEQKLLYWEVR